MFCTSAFLANTDVNKFVSVTGGVPLSVTPRLPHCLYLTFMRRDTCRPILLAGHQVGLSCFITRWRDALLTRRRRADEIIAFRPPHSASTPAAAHVHLTATADILIPPDVEPKFISRQQHSSCRRPSNSTSANVACIYHDLRRYTEFTPATPIDATQLRELGIRLHRSVGWFCAQ